MDSRQQQAIFIGIEAGLAILRAFLSQPKTEAKKTPSSKKKRSTIPSPVK